MSTKLWHYRYRPHIFGAFFAVKAFFEPTTQNNIFWQFFDPKFWGKFFFCLQKPTFKWVCGPQSFIFHTPNINTICPYLKKIFQSNNIWYFLHLLKFLKSKIPNIFRPKYFFEIWTFFLGRFWPIFYFSPK